MSNQLPGDNQQDLTNTSQQGGGGQVRVEPSQQTLASQQTQSFIQVKQPVSGKAKEQKEVGPLRRPEVEKIPIIEIKELELSKEVEGWVEKLEKGEEIQLPQPITDDYGQILVEASVKQKPKIVLPLDEREVKQAQKHKVVDSIRWLAEWCLRIIKLAKGRVFYKKS